MKPRLTVSPKTISPLSTSSIPVTILNNVVFPAPFGPIIPTIAPGGTSKDKSSINSLPSYDFFIFLAFITTLPSLSPKGIVICCGLGPFSLDNASDKRDSYALTLA